MTEESSDAPTTADADVFMSSITLSTFPSLAANLSKLNLRNQGFVQVPAEVWACEQLTQLDIGGNPVTALEGIQALGKLRIFFATGCKLGPVLPPDGPLAQVGSLTMLSLADNGLKVLDGAALPASLEWLIAKQNQLVEVRNAYRLCRVRKLGLAHNQLDTEMVRARLARTPNPNPSPKPDPSPSHGPDHNPNPDRCARSCATAARRSSCCASRATPSRACRRSSGVSAALSSPGSGVQAAPTTSGTPRRRSRSCLPRRACSSLQTGARSRWARSSAGAQALSCARGRGAASPWRSRCVARRYPYPYPYSYPYPKPQPQPQPLPQPQP